MRLLMKQGKERRSDGMFQLYELLQGYQAS